MEPPEPSDWVQIIDRLGPGTVVLLVLAVMVALIARQYLTAPAASASPDRDIGKLEGLLQGHTERMDGLEDRIASLEKERRK